MPDFVLALLIKPFVLLIISVVFFIPARLAVQKMKDGKLKRLLLWRVGP